MTTPLSENHFYLISEDYINLINQLGGKYFDKKERPLYCCIKDRDVEGLYWLIPTSNLQHRDEKQIQKVNEYCSKDVKDIRSAYYYIGTTNRPALFKISNALPITEKYIEKEYLHIGKPLVLEDKQQIQAIQEKLYRILSFEKSKPNKLEQHITSIRNYLCEELKREHSVDHSLENVTLLEDKLKQAEQRIEQLSEQLENSIQEHKKTTILAEDLTQQLKTALEKLEQATQATKSLTEQLDKAKQEVSEIATQNQELSETLDKYITECRKAKAIINEANAILDTNPALKQQYSKAKNDYRTQSNQHNTSLQQAPQPQQPKNGSKPKR